MSKVDPQRPSSWKKYRDGLCDNCNAGCCTLPVEVTIADFIRLNITDEFEVKEDFKGLLKRLKKEKIIKSYYPPTKVFILETKNYSDCIFLGKDRRCTVYDLRPETCRNFPRIGPRSGFCPHDIHHEIYDDK